MDPSSPATTRFGRFRAALSESPPLLWAFVYFFCLLSGYYVLRPVREAMAASSDVQAVFPPAMIEFFAVRGLAGQALCRCRHGHHGRQVPPEGPAFGEPHAHQALAAHAEAGHRVGRVGLVGQRPTRRKVQPAHPAVGLRHQQHGPALAGVAVVGAAGGHGLALQLGQGQRRPLPGGQVHIVLPWVGRRMQRQAEGLRQRGPHRQDGGGVGQRPGLVGVAQTLHQAPGRELQKAQQGAQCLRGRQRRRLGVDGVVKHHRRVAVRAGQGNLGPRLALVPGRGGLGQRRHLQEGLLRVEQREMVPPMVQVVLHGLQGQPVPEPADAIGRAPVPLRPRQGTVGDGQQQAVLGDEAGRSGLGQGHDLPAALKHLAQAQVQHPAVGQTDRQPGFVEQAEVLAHAVSSGAVAGGATCS